MKKFLQSDLWQNLKSKLGNYGFWMSLTGAIVVFLQSMGVKIDNEIASEVVGAFCSILVVLGIVSNPSVGRGYIDKLKTKKENKSEIEIAASDELLNEKSANVEQSSEDLLGGVLQDEELLNKETSK